MDWKRIAEDCFDAPRVVWAWLLSFRRKEWGLEDYPLRFQQFDNSGYQGSADERPIDWTAQVVRWVAMQGYGTTREEALEDLHKGFARFKERGESLPRPGTYKPIEFASSERIDRFASIKEDFIAHILNLEWAFVSDESTLWDFSEADNLEIFYERIKSRYGVDVSAIEGARLVTIFERLDGMQS